MGVLFMLASLSWTVLPGVFGNVVDIELLQSVADFFQLELLTPETQRQLQSATCEIRFCDKCNAANRNICDICRAPYKKVTGKCEKTDQEEPAFYLPWWVWLAIIVSVLLSCIGCAILCCWACGCISDEKLGLRNNKEKKNDQKHAPDESHYLGPPPQSNSRSPQSRNDRYPPALFPVDESERSPKSPKKKKKKKPRQEVPDWGAGDDWGGHGGHNSPGGQVGGYYDEQGRWITGYYDEQGRWITT